MPSDEFAALVRAAKGIQSDIREAQKKLDKLAEDMADYKKSGEKPESKGGKSLLDSLLGGDEE